MGSHGDEPESAGCGEAARPLPAIGAPATRALASIGVTTLDEVARHSAAELLALHGFGPKALRILNEALHHAGLTLRA